MLSNNNVVFEQLSSKKWSERKEGMEALLKWTQVELNDADALAADTVARLLQVKKLMFKYSNI